MQEFPVSKSFNGLVMVERVKQRTLSLLTIATLDGGNDPGQPGIHLNRQQAQ